MIILTEDHQAIPLQIQTETTITITTHQITTHQEVIPLAHHALQIAVVEA